MAEEREVDDLGGTPEGYEPPEVIALGTLADLTQGVVPTTTDGVLPGSVL